MEILIIKTGLGHIPRKKTIIFHFNMIFLNYFIILLPLVVITFWWQQEVICTWWQINHQKLFKSICYLFNLYVNAAVVGCGAAYKFNCIIKMLKGSNRKIHLGGMFMLQACCIMSHTLCRMQPLRNNLISVHFIVKRQTSDKQQHRVSSRSTSHRFTAVITPSFQRENLDENQVLKLYFSIRI